MTIIYGHALAHLLQMVIIFIIDLNRAFQAHYHLWSLCLLDAKELKKTLILQLFYSQNKVP